MKIEVKCLLMSIWQKRIIVYDLCGNLKASFKAEVGYLCIIEYIISIMIIYLL